MLSDKLLIFYGSIKSSTGCVKNNISFFGAKLGLQMNPPKSKIYFSGIMEETQQDILEEMGFPRGELPVHYLGVLNAVCRSLEQLMSWFLLERPSLDPLPPTKPR